MKNVMIVSAIAAMAVASAANAGGIAEPVMEPAPAPVVTPMAPMSSDWTGFYVGGQIGAAKVKDDGDLTTLDSDATNYGLQAGYLYDLGSFVVGGEASYNRLDIDAFDNSDSYVVRAGVLAGYDAGRFMPYLAGGYAYADADTGVTTLSDSGYYYGLGATYAVTDSLQVGVEYLEHKFDDFDSSGIDLKAQTTSLKVSFAF